MPGFRALARPSPAVRAKRRRSWATAPETWLAGCMQATERIAHWSSAFEWKPELVHPSLKHFVGDNMLNAATRTGQNSYDDGDKDDHNRNRDHNQNHINTKLVRGRV